MKLAHLETGLTRGLCVLSLTLFGCGDDSGSGADTVGSNGTTVGGATDDSGGTSPATAGTADETADEGPVDPTEGVEPPVVDCGAGGTLMGGLSIEGDADVAQLDGIAIVTGDIIIDSTNYSNLDFLSCLTEVQGNIQIFNNAFLLDMSGTDNLTRIGRLPAPNPTPTSPSSWDAGKGSISISNNPSLTTINGFGSLTDLGEQGEPGDCPAMPADVECISRQSLIVRENGGTSVSGFGSLAFIFGSLTISQNDSLLDIDGLTSLVGIGGFFAVNNNTNLCESSVNAVGAALEFLGDMGSSTTAGNDSSC